VSFQYDDSPNNLDTIISPDEATEIANADPRQFTKDPERFRHYASRVARTVKALRGQILGLHRDMQAVQVNRSQAGAPATLSPIEAVKYLTDEQFAAVADSILSTRLTAAALAEQQALDARSFATSRINEAKLVLGSLVDDASIPEKARAKISAILTRFNTASTQLTGLNDIFADQPANPTADPPVE
jgi:hypothetical protein